MKRWHITLFGGIHVNIEEDGEIRPAQVEPGRLALLAYLATEAAGQFRTRDSILGLLWPDSPERLARLALRQALYHLTKRLGPGLIVRRGRQRVGVDRERMVCDVHRFEAALREARPQDALVEYRGDFLEGFVLTSQPEPFEEWIRSTRLRLLDGAISAVTTLAERERTQGEADPTLGWVHRALALSPYSESLLGRAVDLLLERGDRGGALREVDLFARRLHVDTGLGSSHHVEELRARAISPGPEVRATSEIQLPPDGLRVELEGILTGQVDRAERLIVGRAAGDVSTTYRVVLERRLGERGEIALLRLEQVVD